jgi:hypothetical protein
VSSQQCHLPTWILEKCPTFSAPSVLHLNLATCAGPTIRHDGQLCAQFRISSLAFQIRDPLCKAELANI